jgi:hypothetical protein
MRSAPPVHNISQIRTSFFYDSSSSDHNRSPNDRRFGYSLPVPISRARNPTECWPKHPPSHFTTLPTLSSLAFRGPFQTRNALSSSHPPFIPKQIISHQSYQSKLSQITHLHFCHETIDVFLSTAIPLPHFTPSDSPSVISCSQG